MIQSLLLTGPTIAHIDFSHVMSVPVIKATISHHSDETKSKLCTAWFDTGATNSVISRELFEYLTPQKSTIVAEGVRGGVDLDSAKPRSEELFTVKFRISSNVDNSIFEDTLDVIVSSSLRKEIDALIGLEILQKSQFNYNGIKKTYTISFPIIPAVKEDIKPLIG